MKNNFIKRTLTVGIVTLMSCSLMAQEDGINPVFTTAPSMIIAPDARAGGMGDAGVATAPDIYSQHWNPAKYAFAPSQAGFGFSYTPWLRKIVNDVALMYGVGYYKLGEGDNQALSASIRYFSIGDIPMHDAQGVLQNTVAPHELAFDIGYSRKLTETFSGAVTVRYIRADYSGGDDEGSAGSTFAADIAGYNESYIRIGQSESLLSLGFNVSNIGGKISNNDGQTSSFIPTNLRLGASLMYPINEVSTISGSLDFNKLLVPTPPVRKDETEAEWAKKEDDYRNISSVSGIFKSFGDAPGGFSEEMKEIAISTGLEYDYDKKFKVRTGYFHENKMKGNRRYFTFGAGFHMNGFMIDAGYLLSTAQQSPLDQTIRFSLGFDIESMKKLFNR